MNTQATKQGARQDLTWLQKQSRRGPSHGNSGSAWVARDGLRSGVQTLQISRVSARALRGWPGARQLHGGDEQAWLDMRADHPATGSRLCLDGDLKLVLAAADRLRCFAVARKSLKSVLGLLEASVQARGDRLFSSAAAGDRRGMVVGRHHQPHAISAYFYLRRRLRRGGSLRCFRHDQLNESCRGWVVQMLDAIAQPFRLMRLGLDVATEAELLFCFRQHNRPCVRLKSRWRRCGALDQASTWF